MDIGTGKDHPQNIKIHLINIINPNQLFSSAEYRQLALEKVYEIQAKNKLPIIVGGTGYYIDAIVNPQSTFSIKPNNFLRFFLNKLPVSVLQKIFYLLDKNNYQILNNSDVHNPHRLIRKIEIKLSNRSIIKDKWLNDKFDILHVSLTAPNQYIFDKIDIRIMQRLDDGLLDEIKNLLTKYRWSDPGLNCLAYKDFYPYFAETHDRASLLTNCIKLWTFAEHAFARRQKTWFKKIKNILFFDITSPSFPHNILRVINKWYN
jgi:tRNA dimethylallyltransferase